MKAIPSVAHEHFYSESIRLLGLDKVSSEQRVSCLRRLSADDLAKISKFPSRPFVDDDVYPAVPTFGSIGKTLPPTLHKGWCRDIFIGNCTFDVRDDIKLLSHRY